MQIVVLDDASFANEPEQMNQHSYVILMADRERCDNIVYYASSRCHNVSRYVMAPEVHVLVHAVDV